MHIEFHTTKNEANIRDRNLSFERAAEFDFDTAVIEQDTRRDYPETRFVAVGFLGERLYVLCFTPVAGGIRVISFRKANRREIESYDQTCTADR
ncbi:BrnT family toxin [Verminephrobacter eiseniae]|uniref:BrnT family toxin n=1 Tax=Verminephrobacter eiseniae TaxID=364317 RepID=UPI0022372049|nr:BrnT family toxin [Verminephrobacter eiseniae]MCW5238415.1 BrnT family toxin [Verminephrobacter eiseniae]